MDNDVDIYADLPSIHLNNQQNEHVCNCEELNKKVDLLASELEDLKKIKHNLENNLSSLLKTAKAEIARKDRMIDDLRKSLDDTAFRRNRARESRSFSNYKMPNQQYDTTKQHENVPAMRDNESKSRDTEPCQDENKNSTIVCDVHIDIDPQISTVFGERMHKRIVESVKEDEKQRLSTLREKENRAEESNKANGSESSINKNESTFITRNPDMDTTYVRKSEKRPIEDNSTHGSKRTKTDDNKDESASDKQLYNNCVTQYDPKDDAHSFRKGQPATLGAAHRSASEGRKQTRSSSERKRDDRNDSRRDYDGSRSRKGSVDSTRNYRNASTSNHLSDGLDNEYKNGYRYSPSRRHYSKSRSQDQESSGSHRSRERSSRIYRDRRYNDYEHSSRYRNDRAKKDYDNDKSRCTKREYGNPRDRFKHSSSDIEDNNSYRYKKHQYRETKESTPNIPDNANSYKRSNDAAAAHARDLHNLEEGEILDSPEKKNNCPSIRRNNEIINNNEKIVENEIKDDLTSASVDDGAANVPSNVTSTKQKVEDVKVQEIKAEVALHLPRANLREDDGKEVMQVKSCETNDVTIKKERARNVDVDTTGEYSTSARSDAATTRPARDNNANDNHIIDTDKTIQSSTKTFVKIEDTNSCNVRETDEIAKSSKSESTESSVKKEATDDPNTESVTKSESNDDDRKTESAKLENSPVKLTVQRETVLNDEDTMKKGKDDETEVQDPNETCSKASDKSDVEMSRLCLSDHNYVRDPAVDPAVDAAVDSDAVQKSAVTSENCKTVPETLKVTKVTQVAEVVRSASANKTTSSSAKTKKNQRTKGPVISRRRRVVTLSDSNASMTVLMNKTATATAAVNQINCNGGDDDDDDDDIALKPRLRAANSRTSSKLNPR